jgi:hypothetical protein
MVFVLVLAPQHMKYETLVPSVQWLIIAAAAALFFGAVVLLIIRRWGVSQVCNATLIPVLASLVFLLGFYGKELDVNYSARPLAREIQQLAPNVELVATDQISGSSTSAIKRDMDYGLAFYRDRPLIHYETDGVPDAEHILVVRANDNSNLDRWLSGRVYIPLFLYESQGLEVYRVYAKPSTGRERSGTR